MAVLLHTLAALALAVCLPACSADTPRNPSFDVTRAEARGVVATLKAERPRAVRPVVVVGGLYDPLNISTADLAGRIEAMLDKRDEPISINVFGAGSMDACRARVVERIEAWRPSSDPSQTVEVDVVGFSLGAIVARDAATARVGERRLNVARIFSIAGPHRGAAAAELPDLDDRVRAIQPGSAFVETLNDPGRAGATYELLCYIRLGDKIVGEANAAPPGEVAWWVPTGALERHHGEAYKDPRILADIGRRLAGLPGLATEPASELPAE
jgi:hypothetical protein